MRRYKYVFFRCYQRDVHEYCSFKDALDRFISDFDLGETYGIGIYDRNTKILYLPDYFDEEQHSQSTKEVEKLGCEIKKIKTFEV